MPDQFSGTQKDAPDTWLLSKLIICNLSFVFWYNLPYMWWFDLKSVKKKKGVG